MCHLCTWLRNWLYLTPASMAGNKESRLQVLQEDRLVLWSHHSEVHKWNFITHTVPFHSISILVKPKYHTITQVLLPASVQPRCVLDCRCFPSCSGCMAQERKNTLREQNHHQPLQLATLHHIASCRAETKVAAACSRYITLLNWRLHSLT